MIITPISQNELIQQMKNMQLEASSVTGSENSINNTFQKYFSNALSAVNTQEVKSENLKKAYVEQDPSVSLSSVMIQMQKAEISLNAVTAVRNKLLEGYKTLINLNV